MSACLSFLCKENFCVAFVFAWCKLKISVTKNPTCKIADLFWWYICNAQICRKKLTVQLYYIEIVLSEFVMNSLFVTLLDGFLYWTVMYNFWVVSDLWCKTPKCQQWTFTAGYHDNSEGSHLEKWFPEWIV